MSSAIYSRLYIDLHMWAIAQKPRISESMGCKHCWCVMRDSYCTCAAPCCGTVMHVCFLFHNAGFLLKIWWRYELIYCSALKRLTNSSVCLSELSFHSFILSSILCLVLFSVCKFYALLACLSLHCILCDIAITILENMRYKCGEEFEKKGNISSGTRPFSLPGHQISMLCEASWRLIQTHKMSFKTQDFTQESDNR